MGKERKRLDTLLAERALFVSRSAARAAVMAGLVSVDGQQVDKPGTQVTANVAVTVKELPRYVSRGGLKLEKALAAFQIELAGRTAMDVGASTGGFTDCMLQQGAEKVYSVDVGYGQLDWRLRQDSRVVNLERTNIRYLEAEALAEAVQFASIDVAFISLALVLPTLQRLQVPEIVALVKPQFEVGKGRVGKKGVVRDPADHLAVLQKVASLAVELNYDVAGVSYSPIRGPEGNIEYLLHLLAATDAAAIAKEIDFAATVAEAHQELTEKRKPANRDE
ncbi:MAG TPA: TlyA family RNA methyltransferase [Oscillospiraceae bacterium]|nr:TlyA family RNA methyltransferase [Oscillospiraceae bacterium]